MVEIRLGQGSEDDGQVRKVSAVEVPEHSGAEIPVGPGFPGTWDVAVPGVGEVTWEGFYTGPYRLDPGEIDGICRALLGIGPEEVPDAAGRELRPYVSDGSPVVSVVLHSATPMLKSLEADLDDTVNGRVADDVATYVETRAVSLARPGDLVVGRTAPWRAAAALAAETDGVELVEVPGIEYYYLSHALLRLAAMEGERSPVLARLIDTVRTRPQTLVRLYAVDLEIQIFLLYLKRAAGVPALRTDANSPEVGSYWNTKAPLHPTVTDAAALSVADLAPYEVMRAEAAVAPLGRRLGVRCPVVPGYAIDGRRPDIEAVHAQLVTAGRLFAERYGIVRGCLKPSEGGAGARIVPGLDLTDPVTLARQAERVWRAQETFVLEAHVDYLDSPLAPGVFLSPSGHVRDGHLAPGLTLQLTNGTSWQGNVFFEEEYAGQVGLSAAAYRTVRDALAELRDGFAGQDLSVVTAGFDFAVGRLGGRFGDEAQVVLQDPNLSSHGAEYLRFFRDRVLEKGGPGCAVTQVVDPALDLRALRARTDGRPPWSEVISSIPGRWGMLAVAADSPREAAARMAAWHDAWTEAGLIRPAPRR
ncbi:hypothetical protein SLA_2954 [Streptomyces laurentii]|uniref:Uncharacterized protein n=1 Tax=Streptomyces laurentii TaxID=39478 RepID=A0A160P0Q1_STRLU|nr:hypothetical protein SLA_2954 [Streptomyces laurentii]